MGPGENMSEYTINVNRHREIVRWKIARSELTDAHKVILMLLVDYANSKTRVAYPDFVLLSEKTGYHRTTIIRAINAGRTAKLVHRLRKGGIVAGRTLANEYTFPLTRAEIADHRKAFDASSNAQAHSSQPATPYSEVSIPLGNPHSSQPATDLVAGSYFHSSQPATPYSDKYSEEYTLVEHTESSLKRNSFEETFDSTFGHSAKTFSEGREIITLSPTLIPVQAEMPQEGSSEHIPDYSEIATAIRKSWKGFSPTQVNRHMRTYGPAKTLEVVECAAGLGKPDINKVLEGPLMEWSTPTLTEIEYTEELRRLYRSEVLAHTQ
jgi:hypothetical protein